jgi:hypothetical protein
MRRIFIICSVRDADDDYRAKLEAYADMLEENGAEVHLPHRDTDQEQSGLDICRQNAMAINLSNEVHVFYSKESQGTHFDMGVAFALAEIAGRDIKIVPVDVTIEPKNVRTFARMIGEWEIDQTQVLTSAGLLNQLEGENDYPECDISMRDLRELDELDTGGIIV